jgi:hypothetical protein
VAGGRVSEGGGVEPSCKLPGAEAVVETGRRRFASSRDHPRLPLPTTGAANERNMNLDVVLKDIVNCDDT